MKKYKIDVPVLLIFFVRDDTFAQVFETIREARPSKLLLWQDGPRDGRSDDIEAIRKCRKIAENIDWDCEVYKYYNDINLGCDPSTFYAQKWAFSLVDKCIILEDDQVPSQSYFYYCKELLEKYENDERINHICGHNFMGTADWCPYDYMFAYAGTGAWASWRRVAEKWDGEYSFLDDEYSLKNLSYHYGKRSESWIKTARYQRGTQKAFWESILGVGSALDSRYAIIPKHNLVQNIGVGQNATHSTINDLRIMNKSVRAIYKNKAQDISLPLKHPKYVIADAEYAMRVDRSNNRNFMRRTMNKMELVINMLRYGEIKMVFNAIKKRLTKRRK